MPRSPAGKLRTAQGEYRAVLIAALDRLRRPDQRVDDVLRIRIGWHAQNRPHFAARPQHFQFRAIAHHQPAPAGRKLPGHRIE
jgi:hypothetical protein